MKILVVEDYAGVRDSLVDFFTGAGHKVHAVSDGRNALLRLAGGSVPFDLVLVDYTLPGGVLGDEVVRRAKELRIPVILMIAGDEDDVQIGRAAGADRVLRKLFNLTDLEQAIAELCTVS